MTADTTPSLDILRPIIGIENRSAQEVFDIMCDRFRKAASYITELEGREHRVCEGCGHSMSDAEIAAHPTAVSCCPERKMLTAAEWRARAEPAEAKLTERADQTQDVIAALYKAWPDAEDIPADWPLGIIGCIEQIIAEREAAEANARRLSEALATLQEQAQPLPKSYQWTGVKAAEDLFDMEVRHRNGSKPADYLRGWLGMFRPFAFATKDDSWGELEKLISITMRNYVQLLAAVAALSTTKEADREPV